MIKKFLLFALLMFPVLSFAQESQKIAYVKYQDVILSMPEYRLMIDSLQKSEQELQNEINIISDEYTKKLSEFVEQQESMSESIKIRRREELNGIQERAQNFQIQAQQLQEELQRSLFTPIQNKFQKAVEDVGAENNFLYVFDSQVMLFISPAATDATPLVKKKLGIQ